MHEEMELKSLQPSRGGMKRHITETGVKLGALLCAAVAVFAVSIPGYAGEASWSKHTTVVELTPTGQQRYEFRLNLTESPAGCKNPDTFYQDYDAVGSERMYNLLLHALTDDKEVRVYATGRCELNGYAEISAVSIRR
jgi:hypothetical protein